MTHPFADSPTAEDFDRRCKLLGARSKKAEKYIREKTDRSTYVKYFLIEKHRVSPHMTTTSGIGLVRGER